MKNMKRSLLALALISMTTNLLPHGGGGGFGGGFATGAILGTGLTLAATSGSRNSESPETYNMRSLDKRIREKERELRRAKKRGNQNDVNNLQLELNSLNRQRAQAAA